MFSIRNSRFTKSIVFQFDLYFAPYLTKVWGFYVLYHYCQFYPYIFATKHQIDFLQKVPFLDTFRKKSILS